MTRQAKAGAVLVVVGTVSAYYGLSYLGEAGRQADPTVAGIAGMIGLIISLFAVTYLLLAAATWRGSARAAAWAQGLAVVGIGFGLLLVWFALTSPTGPYWATTVRGLLLAAADGFAIAQLRRRRTTRDRVGSLTR